MNQQKLSIYGYRVGMSDYKNEDYYVGNNRKLRALRRKIKETVLIIRAEKCLRTEGKVFGKEYKTLRKYLSDKTILEKYEVLKESLGLALVARHGNR